MKNVVSIRPARGFTRFSGAKPRVLSCFSNFQCQKCRVFEGSKVKVKKHEAFWRVGGGGIDEKPPPRRLVKVTFCKKTPRRASGLEGGCGPPAGDEVLRTSLLQEGR